MSDLRGRLPSLPLPIAQLVKRVLEARSSLARHNNAFYLAECSLKLAAAVRIGLWLQHGLRSDSDLARRLQALVLPSTGHWVEYFRETSRALTTMPGAADVPIARTAHLVARRQPSWDGVRRFAEIAREHGVLSDVVVNAGLRRGALGLFEMIVAYRNEVIGHGAQRVDAFYEQFAKALFAAVQDVLGTTILFDDLVLATPRLELADEAQSRLVWMHLMGAAGIMTNEDAGEATPGRLFFIGKDVRIPLHPLAVYAADDETGRERVGFLNRTTRARSENEVRTAEYLDYSSGERVQGVDARPELSALLAQLAGRKLETSDVDALARETMGGSLEPRVEDPRDRASPVAPGETIAGKYEVDEVLGVGAMGVVVAARHKDLGEVAIKFLRPSAAAEKNQIARFIGEARAASTIGSEHVVRVTDTGELHDGTPYIVMERLEGADLARVLRARGRLPPRDAASYLLQVCEALAEAHAAGIVHRDIKPSNLFVARRKDGTPLLKILDFGISKLGDAAGVMDQALTQTNTVVGTPHYMAPEQMKAAKDVTALADIWSLGVVLFECLSGQLPFQAESYAELCARVLASPAPLLDSVAKDVPPELVRLVARCLEREPAKRPANAAVVARVLAPFGDAAGRVSAERAARVLNEPVEDIAEEAPVPPRPVERPVEAPTERRDLRPLAMIALAVVAVSLGIGWLRSESTSRDRTQPAQVSSPTVAESVSAVSISPTPVAESLPVTSSMPTTSTASTPSQQPPPRATSTTRGAATRTDGGAAAPPTSTSPSATAPGPTATTWDDITQRLMKSNRPDGG